MTRGDLPVAGSFLWRSFEETSEAFLDCNLVRQVPLEPCSRRILLLLSLIRSYFIQVDVGGISGYTLRYVVFHLFCH